eukprot:1149639-Pelagomonas_calceolata.AAC.1
MASARVCMSTALAIIFLSLRPRFLAQIVQSIQNAPTRTEDSGCPSTCSPSAADRAQCPPARHAFRYEVEDTVGRTTTHNVFVRIEAGAAHALNVTMALSCSAGAAELQEQVGCDASLGRLWAWESVEAGILNQIHVANVQTDVDTCVGTVAFCLHAAPACMSLALLKCQVIWSSLACDPVCVLVCRHEQRRGGETWLQLAVWSLASGAAC